MIFAAPDFLSFYCTAAVVAPKKIGATAAMGCRTCRSSAALRLRLLRQPGGSRLPRARDNGDTSPPTGRETPTWAARVRRTNHKMSSR
jgi:hypothetical protein